MTVSGRGAYPADRRVGVSGIRLSGVRDRTSAGRKRNPGRTRARGVEREAGTTTPGGVGRDHGNSDRPRRDQVPTREQFAWNRPPPGYNRGDRHSARLVAGSLGEAPRPRSGASITCPHPCAARALPAGLPRVDGARRRLHLFERSYTIEVALPQRLSAARLEPPPRRQKREVAPVDPPTGATSRSRILGRVIHIPARGAALSTVSAAFGAPTRGPGRGWDMVGGMGQIIAVLPASGGVGATCLGAALAVRAAAAGRGVVAVDLDPWSGGLDVTFGVEQEPGWRWDQLRDASGVVDGERLAARLPSVLDVAVLSMTSARGGLAEVQLDPGPWVDRAPDVVAGLADAHDVTVLDACRDERVLHVVVGQADAIVLVVGTRTPELAAAATVAPALQALGADPWVVLRGPGAGELEDIVIDELDVEVVGTLGEDGRLTGEIAQGIPPGHRGRGPLVALADQLLLRLVTVGVDLGRSA